MSRSLVEQADRAMIADIQTTVPASPAPMTLAEMYRLIDDMNRLIDDMTTVIVCHPYDRARIETALESMRESGTPMGPVELIASPHVEVGTMYKLPKTLGQLPPDATMSTRGSTP